MTVEASPAPSYPMRLDVAYPEQLARFGPVYKWLLAIPHFIILYVLSSLISVVTFIAFFAILFTKRYPKGLFDIMVGVYRWQANVGAYIGLMRDEYPPFSWDAGRYPVEFSVEYPEELSRWLIFVKWLLTIPHFIVLIVLWIVALFAWMVAWVVIIFTRKYPRGIFDFLVGVMRWGMRVTVYYNLMRDEYPPFSLK
ncbi:MAG TPA: DUF4389 domain-containing protein [Dehalococcoidia bacterium]|nr:DUF4389 domain-containing protein [Dehalococcoidia bacterium]